ncbi:hypothetical protein ABE562_22305 [Brucella intermedia]|uniref:hypothetical protein n=1 Tax=Brucella intermedia TaxID=94625 RepID=UPI00320AFEAA
MKTIDITPTWGEWANVYRRLAESGEANAIRELRPDFAHAFAAAQALQAIQSKLPDDLNEIACQIVAEEMKKQGF